MSESEGIGALLAAAQVALKQRLASTEGRQRVRQPLDADHLPALSARCLEGFPSGEFPDLAAHIRHHMDRPASEMRSFEFGLDAILDGLKRRRGAV